MKQQTATVDLLNSLLEKNCDSKRGYQKAAEEVDHPSLKGWLMSLAEQRENFKKSIREEIRFLGGEPSVFRHVSGPVQDAFSNLDILFVLNNVDATLTKCLQYELHLLNEQKQLLGQQTGLPSTINLVVGQQENIKVALADLESMAADSSMTY